MVFGLTMTSQFQAAHVVGGPTTEAQQITVQPLPEQPATPRNRADCDFQRQRPVTGVCDVFPQLLLVRGENADAPPPA